jgi:hypothetical protein
MLRVLARNKATLLTPTSDKHSDIRRRGISYPVECLSFLILLITRRRNAFATLDYFLPFFFWGLNSNTGDTPSFIFIVLPTYLPPSVAPVIFALSNPHWSRTNLAALQHFGKSRSISNFVGFGII